MGILSSFFDVVAGVSILAGRSSLLDTNLTTIAGRNFTVRGALGLSFLSVGFLNLWATSRKQRKIERLTKEAESEPQLFLVTYHVYDKDTGRLTYEDAVQITSKDENTAKGDALVMLEEGGLDDEEYEIFKVRPIIQDYQKQLYGAENDDAEGRFYDDLYEKIEAKEKEIRDMWLNFQRVGGYGRRELMELESLEQELAELERMEFKGADTFNASGSGGFGYTQGRQILTNTDYDVDYTWHTDASHIEDDDYGISSEVGDIIGDEKEYLYRDSGSGSYTHRPDAKIDYKWNRKELDSDVVEEQLLAETFNADDEKEWTIIVYEYTDGMNSYAEQSVERGVMTNEELQAFVEEENESYGGERTMRAYIRGYLTGDEWRTAQRLNLSADNFENLNKPNMLDLFMRLANNEIANFGEVSFYDGDNIVKINNYQELRKGLNSGKINTNMIFNYLDNEMSLSQMGAGNPILDYIEEYNAPAAVMRTYKGRKSPSISAKSVKVGTRKRGNDGKMWQVRSVTSRGKRTQRWFKD